MSGGDRASDEVRSARAYLLRVAEPPARALDAFVEQHGAVAAARLVRAGDVPPPVRRETVARHAESAIDEYPDSETDTRLVVPEDEEWPAWPLLSMRIAAARGAPGMTPPLALWVRGSRRLDELTEQALSIVGARAATGYGEHVARELAYGLAGRGSVVFSGAAYGIDGAAHRATLAGAGATVAVLGCAVDVCYPSGHAVLLDRIAEQGAVISEYPPGVGPARHRFLVRNRLLAALTAGTVVVEAGVRSGARNTATSAGILGKAVMAVPGPVTSLTSAGCHDLIRSAGATLVGSLADVLDASGRIEVDPGTDPPRERRTTDGLGEQALRVHEALGVRSGRSVEQIVSVSGVPAPRVRALLSELELDGLVRRCDTGWRRYARRADGDGVR